MNSYFSCSLKKENCTIQFYKLWGMAYCLTGILWNNLFEHYDTDIGIWTCLRKCTLIVKKKHNTEQIKTVWLLVFPFFCLVCIKQFQKSFWCDYFLFMFRFVLSHSSFTKNTTCLQVKIQESMHSKYGMSDLSQTMIFLISPKN